MRVACDDTIGNVSSVRGFVVFGVDRIGNDTLLCGAAAGGCAELRGSFESTATIQLQIDDGVQVHENPARSKTALLICLGFLSYVSFWVDLFCNDHSFN